MGHDLKGRASAVLETFSGTITLSDPPSVPEGGSPRNQNCDFNVGSVFTRQGLWNPFTYSGGSVGPDGGGNAGDVSLGGAAWSNPGNVLLNTGVYASANLGTTLSASSSTSAGSSIGGGVAWTNPTNIDSNSAFASVSLSAGGGTNYTPSGSSGSVSATANSFQPSQIHSATLGGFASIAATNATLYVTVTGTFAGAGMLYLNYSVDNGATWTQAAIWNSPFSGSYVVPITISGFSNLNTVLIQIVADAEWVYGSPISCSLSVSNWYATIPGGSGQTAQTLQAAISGLSIPAGATITGFGLSFNADYSGVAPSFQVGLPVGNVDPVFTLTTSPAVYTAGGSSSLWGYSGWTPSPF